MSNAGYTLIAKVGSKYGDGAFENSKAVASFGIFVNARVLKR
jgi:hypothetical protein